MQVKEHLEIFGVLKGVKEDVLESVVAEMIDEVLSNICTATFCFLSSVCISDGNLLSCFVLCYLFNVAL